MKKVILGVLIVVLFVVLSFNGFAEPRGPKGDRGPQKEQVKADKGCKCECPGCVKGDRMGKGKRGEGRMGKGERRGRGPMGPRGQHEKVGPPEPKFGANPVVID